MRELRPFTEKSYTAATQYDTEFSGRGIAQVGFTFDASIGTATTPFADAAARLVGTPEVVQSELSLMRMEGPDWYHLAALTAGAYPYLLNGATGASAAVHALVDLEALMPGGAINASGAKVFMRGTFGATTDYASDGATIAGTIRPMVVTSALDLAAGSWRRPKFSSFTVDLSSSNTDIQRKIDFDQDLLVVGILVRAFDNSATSRVDGLVRRIRYELTSQGGGTRELVRATWGQLRAYTVKRFGLNNDDVTRSAGVVLVPMTDPRNVESRGAMFVRKGDSGILHFDTSTTAENGYTSVTPAASDRAICTVLAFSIVAGSGQEGADSEIRTVAAATARRRSAGSLRSRLAAARR